MTLPFAGPPDPGSTRPELMRRGLTEAQVAWFRDRQVAADPTVVILGHLPTIVNPYGARMSLGAHTVLNSNPWATMTPVPSPVRFALGVGASIDVGRHCNLNGSSLTAYAGIRIGDYSQIGAGGFICDTDLHPLDPDLRLAQTLGRPFPGASVLRAPITLEENVWIGFGVILLKGVTVGQDSVVAAGSVLAKSVPSGCLVAGNPARVVRHLRASDR